jgi:hypothetical protein
MDFGVRERLVVIRSARNGMLNVLTDSTSLPRGSILGGLTAAADGCLQQEVEGAYAGCFEVDSIESCAKFSIEQDWNC